MIKNLVSVLMSCYNGEKYIGSSVKSLLKQSYEHWELIFFDNCSNDNSFKEISKFHDKRIKYFKNDKLVPIGSAKQKAFECSSGEFISFLDVDDLWLSKKLKNQVSFLNNNENYSAICSNYFILNDNKSKSLLKNNFNKFNSKINFDNLFMSFVKGKPIINNLTTLFRKKELLKLENVFDNNLHVIADFDLILRFTLKNNIYFINEYNSIYRLHSNNETIKTKENQINEFKYWINKNKFNRNFNNNVAFKWIVQKNIYEEIKYMIYNRTNLVNILKLMFKLKKFHLFLKLLFLLIYSKFTFKN